MPDRTSEVNLATRAAAATVANRGPGPIPRPGHPVRVFRCRLASRDDDHAAALAALAAWRDQAGGRAFAVQHATADVLTAQISIDPGDWHARLCLEASASKRRVQAVFEGWLC
jgi:hypothetical protein